MRQEPALKSGKSFGDRTSDEAKSDNSDGRARKARAVKLSAPAVKTLRLDISIAGDDVSSE